MHLEWLRRFSPVLALAAVVSLSDHSAIARGTGGIPAVLEKLNEIQQQVKENAANLADLRQRLSKLDSDVAVLDSNATPCTLERFRKGKCGESNLPFDLTVTLCGSLGAVGDVRGDFQINNSNAFEIGLGWSEVGLIGLKRTIEFPGIPGLVASAPYLGASYVYGIPFPNLQAGATASGGVTLQGCIEVPISVVQHKQAVIDMLEHWQARGSDFQDKVLAAASNLDLQADRISDSVSAMEVFQSKRLSDLADDGLQDPLHIFDRGRSLGNLLEALPVGDRIRSVQDTPEMLVEGFSDVRSTGRPSVTELCGILDNPDRPVLQQATVKACDALGDLPSFDITKQVPEVVDELSDEVLESIAELMDPLLSDKETRQQTKNRFCNSAVGMRPVFDRYCGR